MALEVLEGDEAYRLESSGSISPESDVDRLLENADAERFSGDVTLIRVFSIQRDVEGRFGSGSSDADYNGQDAGLPASMENRDVTELEPDFRRFSNMDEVSLTDELLQSDVELYIGETESEASVTVDRHTRQAFDSAELVSVDLHSNSSSTVGLDDDTSGPKRTSAGGPGNPDRTFADSGLVCGATFSNVKSKGALIRTSLTVNSFPPGQRTSPLSSREREDRGLKTPESEDISLHMTSSDSLYSTDDCFCDSSFPDATTEPHFAAGGRPFPAPGFSRREPSPEDLFDLALESRSDLGGSSIGSSSFYDAVQCSPSTCIHRDPSPEEAFDLALETLSDVIDDDSSSVFVIAPRPSAVSKRPDLRPDLRPDHRPDLRPDLPRPTIVCCRSAYDVENARSKMADMAVNSDSCCDLCGRRRCYTRGGTKGFCCGGRSSSCEAIVDDDQLMRGTIGGSSSVDLLTNCSDWEASCCGRRPHQTRRLQQESEELCWSSDPCPSSPEHSTLADDSTDDCVGGESEEDSSVTDCDGIDASSSLRTNFFHRLLRRRRTDLPVGAGWTKEKTTEEDRLLDQIQICSIEDLMTDSDLERDSWNLKARGTTGLELQLNDNSPILSLFRDIQGRMVGRADEPSNQGVDPVASPVVGPIQPLSPAIAQSMRTDVHFARKSKIPRLPESRTTLSPVRISW